MKPIRIILDFEASAMDGGYPIEVGIAKTWPNGRITSASRVIKHDPWLNHWNWTAEAQKIHAISKDDIALKGLPVGVVARWLNRTIGTQTVYCDSAKDPGWLKTLFSTAGVKPAFELHNIEEVFDAASEIDDDALKAFMSQPAHRAGADAVQISNMVLRCMKFAR